MNRDRQDYQAFMDRIHRNQRILRRIGTVYASSPEDREDLQQEILLQAWRSFPSYRGSAAFSTWLYRVALNTALTRRRSSVRRREVATGGPARLEVEATAPASADPEVEELHHCIRELPGLDRAIILLSLEGHSYEEIAEITGLGRSNVGVRLVRIKDRLRQRLEAIRQREEREP